MDGNSVQRTPRRTPRKISDNVRELHVSLTKVLNNDERTFLIQSLNQYQREKNVNSLVVSLKSVLNTPRKREVYPLLWQIIPHSDQEIFHYLWHSGFETPRQRTNSKSPARSPATLRRDATSSSLPDNLNRHASDSGIDLPNMTQFGSSRDSKYPIKQLTIKRPSNSGFGFCIRGGAEHGVGLYVSSVDELSVAEKEGLLPGDHIIQVNGTKFDGLTHSEAVKIIQQSKKLNVFVRSVGRVPNSFVAESTCKWVDMRGRRASPPPGVDSNGRILMSDGIHKSDLRLLGDDDERKVNISVEDGTKLGLMIRGGSDYGLGIYIAGVDPDGAAEQAGLKAGDQILDVNGQSFLNISHKKAVKVLKSTKNMIVTLKDIGRLPFTRVTHDKTKWITSSAKNGQIHRVPEVTHITEVEVHSPPGSAQQGQTRPSNRRHTTGRMHQSEPSMFHHGIAGSQVLYNGGLPSQKNLVTEQARQILNENELGTLTYYLEEYSKGYISVSAFALALFDLLNTPAKMSLMTEIRSSVAPRDIDRFDDLVLKKEIEIMKSRQFLGNHLDDDRHSLHSYASSVSSFSGRESSSKSSAKGSLDGTGSRPITPPQVPEILPPNVKVNHDIKTDTSQSYEVYEATLTFHEEKEQTFDFEDEDIMGLPSFLTIDPVSLDLPATESAPVPFPVDVSPPTSSAMNVHVSPTKTVGEATTSLPVGDNTRKDKRGRDAQFEGHRTTSYTNGEVSPTGQQPQKSESPPNPFIFPTSFQGNTTDVEYPASISAVFESSFKKQSSSTSTSPREPVAMQNKAQPKNKGKNVVATVDDEDLRPEVAKLPGRKRVASWGEVPDEPAPLANETTALANANGPPSVKTNTSQGSVGSPSVNQREYAWEDHSRSRTGDKRSSGEARTVARERLNNQVYDASSESSSPSHSQQSSVIKNRKSWDGVRNPGESEQKQTGSRLEIQKDNKERSCSDSNLMNLPKAQQKSIQAKHRASQELYDLHQQCKTKTNTSHQDENLHQQPNTVTIEARDSVESPRRNVKELVDSVFEVEVDKSSRSLGITLEGGSDAGGDIRIKSVKEGNFAAWKCGRLKAGQVVLQVDGTPLTGMTSGTAVLTLRHAYSSSNSPVLKLLIRGI